MPRYYPDPERVLVTSAKLQPARRPVITTRSAGRLAPVHSHTAFIEMGALGWEGNTDVVNGHFHRIKNGRVYASESDGHTHELVTYVSGGAG